MVFVDCFGQVAYVTLSLIMDRNFALMQPTLFSRFPAVNFLVSLFDTIISKKCPLCATPYAHGYCDNCQKLLPWITRSCTRCASELATPGVCGICQKSPPPFYESHIPFYYAPPISTHILRLKYAQLHHVWALGIALANKIKFDTKPDIIIPIPLHKKRLIERGFNQSAEIAKVVSSHFNIAIDYDSLIRTKNTISQQGLTEKQRQRNLKTAFTCQRKLSYQHVALVDDVVTSGSTVRSASIALKKCGVQKISIWALAKTNFRNTS